MAKLSDIERLGFCNGCKQWCLLEKGANWLPDHNKKNGKKCPDSKYSHWGFKYRIKTREEAVAVAQFIKNDKGGCLSSGGLHSLACGDGEYCESKRLLWAQALAEYFLTHKC